MADEQPKIFIDEGWKAQVQKEKEEALHKEPETVPPAEALDADAPMTPFIEMVQFLATQALLALGVIAPQDSPQVYVDLDMAQAFIDMLAVLRDKTKGNLAADEAGHLDQILAECQQIYVMRAEQVQQAELKGAKPQPKKPGGGLI